MNWNKHFFRLLKTVFTSYPYDYCYLLEIEAAKIREMAEHFKKVNSGEKIGFAYEGMEKDVWYMELAVKLIDIMVHDENLFHYDFDKATKVSTFFKFFTKSVFRNCQQKVFSQQSFKKEQCFANYAKGRTLQHIKFFGI